MMVAECVLTQEG
ncbi:Protein of unknown function [Propionibacterium freudenreichii subsp. freudenreichii]|nr:Protein of unknown function [Propionibacterium freudenreichii subsp. freudenreichii]CEG97530.1 Protein of unknown function [Propionibacterium freudenreichii]CEH06918.1 Protein of unknown function [Propionibacterium freudenreichii]